MKVFDGRTTLELVKKDNLLLVYLDGKQFDNESLEVLKQQGINFVPLDMEDYQLLLTYQLPDGAKSLIQAIKETRSTEERLELANKLFGLERYTNRFKIPFIHPENIYLIGDEVVFIHFGLTEALSPFQYDEELFSMQYRALVFNIFSPESDYESLFQTQQIPQDSLSSSIKDEHSPEAISRQIKQSLKKRYLKKEKAESFGKLILQLGLVIVIFALLVVGFLTIKAYNFSLPGKDTIISSRDQTITEKDATIQAQSDYQAGNYPQALDDLKKYNFINLPKPVRLMLARSSLTVNKQATSAQKNSWMPALTLDSPDNLINFWIYQGRAQYKNALDLAENMVSIPLMVFSYQGLVAQVTADTQMDGGKKQTLLQQYNQAIQQLEQPSSNK